MAQFDIDSLKLLMEKISNGVDLPSTTKTLAAIDVPLAVAIDLRIVETLTPLSGSHILAGAIHEVLKKLEGKKEVKNSGKKTRRTSSKKILKTRRSGGGVKESHAKEEKENEKTTPKRLFKKKEPRKKDSTMWKRIKKSQN